MRKWTVLTLALVLALALPLLAQPAQAQDGEPLKIGLMTDLTGALQIYGVELQNGFMLGLEYATDGTMEVAGRPIEVVVRDYANDADLAATQARELLEVEGVEVLVGAPSSLVAQGLVSIAAEYDVVLMAGPAAAKNLTGELFEPTTFRACRNSWHDAKVLAPYWADAVGDTFIQLAADYAFGREEAEAFEYYLKQEGVTPVKDTIYAPLDTTDFTPYLQEILDSGAAGVIYIWAGATTIPLVQQIQEMGVTDAMPALAFFNSNELQLAFADATIIPSDGFIVYHYTLPDTEINDWLVERHKEEYNDVPDLFTECGFANAQALVLGLEASEGSTITDDLIPALEGIGSWEGPKGTYTMRPEDHSALMPMYAVRITNLTDPEFRFYELLAEIEIDEIPCEAGADRSSETLDCTPLAEREAE